MSNVLADDSALGRVYADTTARNPTPRKSAPASSVHEQARVITNVLGKYQYSTYSEAMSEEPLHSTRWLRIDPPERRRPFATPADTDGELDWDKVTRLSWRPAWAIRSRRGALAPFMQMIRAAVLRR